jgi:hypothetical protein
MRASESACLFLLVSLAVNGCGSRPEGAMESVRDSAEVRIVESRAESPGEAPAWQVDEEQGMRIGVAEGAAEYQLGGVRGAVRLREGGVVIANSQMSALRYYDSAGRFAWAVGRDGSGPGEFKALDGLAAYRGDSVAVWDRALWRLTVVGPDGGVGRTVNVHGLNSVVARLRGALSDGSFVLAAAGSAEDFLRNDPGERRDSVSYLRFTPDGVLADTLDRRAAEEYVTARSGHHILIRPVLFGRDSHVAVGGDRVFVGQSDEFRIDVMDRDGTQVMSIRRTGELRTPTRQELARARSEADAAGDAHVRTTGASGSPRTEPLPARATVPAFDRLIVDQENHLWVRDFLVSPTDSSRWSVYASEGHRVATVQTPPGVEIYQVGSDWILGRGRDDLDVEIVLLYRLRRGAESTGD